MNPSALAAWSVAGITIALASGNPVYRVLVLLCALNVLVALRRPDVSLRGMAIALSVAALIAIVITTLILTSQRRKDELSELREQLTLELAIMTEQKSAKLIALMEELRRDSPQLANRVDTEAEQMSAPADPETVLEAFKEKVDGQTGPEASGGTAKPKGRTPG